MQASSGKMTERGEAAVKSEKAFKTISEVAETLGVPQHVLRFWETRFPQIRPVKRRGGRRYYRPEDVVLLGKIRSYLYEDGFTIKGVKKLLQGGEVSPCAMEDLRPSATLVADLEDVPSSKNATGQEKLSPEARRELERLLGELEGLRALLKVPEPA